eukprot:436820_1
MLMPYRLTKQVDGYYRWTGFSRVPSNLQNKKKCIHVNFGNSCKLTIKYLLKLLNSYENRSLTPDWVWCFEQMNKHHFICGNCINNLFQSVSIDEIINITNENINPHRYHSPQFALIILWSQLLNYWPLRCKMLCSSKYSNRFTWITTLFTYIMTLSDDFLHTQYYLDTAQSILLSILMIIKYWHHEQWFGFANVYHQMKCYNSGNFAVQCMPKEAKRILKKQNVYDKYFKNEIDLVMDTLDSNKAIVKRWMIWNKRKSITCSFENCQKIYTKKNRLKLCKRCHGTTKTKTWSNNDQNSLSNGLLLQSSLSKTRLDYP